MSDPSALISKSGQNWPAHGSAAVLAEQYSTATQLAVDGKLPQAWKLYRELGKQSDSPVFRAIVENDLGTIAALDGDLKLACQHFRAALQIDPECAAAKENLSHRQASLVNSEDVQNYAENPTPLELHVTKVAIVSILFNWPSTGGGTIHTAETGKFLRLAGYEVRHFYSQFSEWGIGRMDQEPLSPSEAIIFDAASWNAPEIQRRFRQAVDAFAPDFVIVTDSWNFKPLLAEAMRGYRYLLRLAAQECLCPLNNVRLLVDDQGVCSACLRHQLATPDVCRKCVSDKELQSGSLHQAERTLSGYGTMEYDRKLREAFAGAEAILAVNPLIAAMVGPYAKRICVVPSGFDPNRFPTVEHRANEPHPAKSCVTLLFAGLTQEYMKGFHILRAACQILWQKRRDFELVVTGDVPARPEDFCRYIGWQSQDQLPHAICSADILVFPTIAEEALGRSAVEAMGAGRPVVASRIGGLQFTVTDEVTGLLFEPGNVPDLVSKIERLIESPQLRRSLGRAGREKFEREFTWEVILQRHYLPLLGPTMVSAAPKSGAN